jgi:thiaminase/transcriptional activator TenA
LEFSNGTITAELDMHGSWLKEWNIQIREEDMSPACQLYTSYLISTAYDRPFEEAAVAYLPCFWIYHLVGQALAQHGSPDPMYQRWIEEYSSKEFEKSVDKMKAIVNQVCEGPLTADKKEILLNHFKRTCQMEYMFWDSAYKNNQWPH